MERWEEVAGVHGGWTVRATICQTTALNDFFIDYVFIIFIIVKTLGFFVQDRAVPPIAVIISGTVGQLKIRSCFVGQGIVLASFLLGLRTNGSELFKMIVV